MVNKIFFYSVKSRQFYFVTQFVLITVLLPIVVACSSGSNTAPANNDDPPTNPQTAVELCTSESESFVNTSLSNADIISGGLAYDKWWVANRGTEPLVDHPLWSTQTTNARSGSVTWRCKECHGWDYLGKDGAYNLTNSHFTNFVGVMDAKAKNPVEVFCAIKSLENHAFGDVMSDSNILDLTALIVDFGGKSEGIIDYNVVLDSNNISIGDGSKGGAGNQDYDSNSAGGCGSTGCHDLDGTKNAGNEFSIGDVAVDNPWEFLHKVRYGQPGAFMPSGISDSQLNLPQMANILAYAQNQLPLQNPGGGSPIEGDYVRGGLLYDNWPTVLTAEGSIEVQPIDTMPLFELRKDKEVNTRSGLQTWRCKECHGWDYQGIDGAYGDPTGSHFTDFPGVLNARNDPGVTESFLLNFLRNGYKDNNDVTVTYHKFSDYMTETDLIDLVSFIKQGVIDTDRYISATPVGAGKGDPVNGQFLYELNTIDAKQTPSCSRCHALNGTGFDFDPDPIATEFLKDIAIRNPWEVLHKIRFGEPSSIDIVNLEMPGTLRDGFTNADAADILTYSQKLPQ